MAMSSSTFSIAGPTPPRSFSRVFGGAYFSATASPPAPAVARERLLLPPSRDALSLRFDAAAGVGELARESLDGPASALAEPDIAAAPTLASALGEGCVDASGVVSAATLLWGVDVSVMPAAAANAAAAAEPGGGGVGGASTTELRLSPLRRTPQPAVMLRFMLGQQFVEVKRQSESERGESFWHTFALARKFEVTCLA